MYIYIYIYVYTHSIHRDPSKVLQKLNIKKKTANINNYKTKQTTEVRKRKRDGHRHLGRVAAAAHLGAKDCTPEIDT